MIYARNRVTGEHAVVNVLTQKIELSGGWEFVKADADGWIPCAGGECPLPDGARCDVKHRDGEVIPDTCVGRRGARRWAHANSIGDIIAYRPIIDAEPSEPEAPEWDGEGLPPVGVECEMAGDNGAWFPVIPVAYGWRDRVCCYAESNGGRLDALAIFSADPSKFRPIRTAAQRAEDEMLNSLPPTMQTATVRIVCRTLHEAGYRKEAT